MKVGNKNKKEIFIVRKGNMETKKMTVANINMVFGKEEEPMIYHLDDIIVPALNSQIKKKSGRDTRFFFEDFKISIGKKQEGKS